MPGNFSALESNFGSREWGRRRVKRIFGVLGPFPNPNEEFDDGSANVARATSERIRDAE